MKNANELSNQKKYQNSNRKTKKVELQGLGYIKLLRKQDERSKKIYK